MKGIEYYSKLIDGLLAKGIEPLVTIYHWDLPQYIQDIGGWTNPMIVDYFEQYADVLYQHYGSRVKKWITVNEPSVFCGEGYGYSTKAPAISSPGVGDYLCGHHVLLANAAAYRLYKKKYFAEQGGQVGICLNSGFSYPEEGVDPSYGDKAIEFELGRFSNAIFSKEGGYPQVMIDQIGNKSVTEGRPWSRLPSMTDAVKQHILGTADFLALNYYTSRMVKPREEDPNLPISWWADTNIDGELDPSWKRAKSQWLYSVPEGLHDLLLWIKNKYDNPTVMITENGWSDEGQLDDVDRVDYLRAHLASVVRAINEDCKIVAYTVWSLTDNFEWKEGYTERFGIHYINFSSPTKERIPKASAEFFKELMITKSFEY
jgi:beta-glucosidase/6-phospho-beta-glucosidase/beta-galactosidase